MPSFRFVDRPAAEPEWKAVHRAADRGIAGIRGPFLDAVEGLRESVSVSDMEVLINQGGAAAVIGEIPWFEFEGALTDAFLPAFKETQNRAMRGLLGVLEDDIPADKVVLTKQDIVARFDLTNPQAVQVAARQAAEAVQQVTASTRRAIREIIRRGQLGLLTVAQQATRIRDLIGLTERQTASVLNFERSLIEQGIAGAELERRVAKKFDQVLKRRATTIARTECLLPETLVDAAVVDTVFRRWYVGTIVEIVTSGGRKLRTTPNHPMLTSRGWMSAATLKEGHDLVCCLRDQDSGASSNPDVERAPATISEIFDSLATVAILERHRGRQPDFHGDGMEGEVDTLRPSRTLLIGRFAPLYKPVVNLFLTPTDEARPTFCLKCRRLLSIDQQPCLCTATKVDSLLHQAPMYRPRGDFQGLGDAGDCFAAHVSDNDFLYRQSGHDVVRLSASSVERLAGVTAVADDPGVIDDTVDPSIVSAHQLPHLNAAEASEIKLDRVVSVRLRSWSGHVYNIATPYGYFNANGLYTGNTIRSANLGQQNLWRQAADQGLIDRDTAQKRWISSADSRVCPICAPMDGQLRPLEEPFVSPFNGAQAMTPPIHGAGRCAMALEVP